MVTYRPGLPSAVEPGEDRHHRQPLHGHGQVGGYQLAQLVRLALQTQRTAFDLFVVLQLQLEQPHHFDGRSSGARDGDTRVAVCGEHLFDRTMADEVARGGSSVPRHDDPVSEPRSEM